MTLRIAGELLARSLYRTLRLGPRDDCGEKGERAHKLVEYIETHREVMLEATPGDALSWAQVSERLRQALLPSADAELVKALAELADCTGGCKLSIEGFTPA